MASRAPYDTHLEMVINRAKFDTRTCSSFGAVKTHRQTHTHTHTHTEMRFIV